jgi:hypothetical protein
MQVQTINDNTNFKAVVSYKVKGKDFKINPEAAQKIFQKFVPLDTYAFGGRTVDALLESHNYNSLSKQLIYGTDMPFNNEVRLSFYEKPKGNMLTRAWKYIKASFAYGFSREKNSKAYAEVSPSEISGYGYNFNEAVYDLIAKINNKQIPTKEYSISRIIH